MSRSQRGTMINPGRTGCFMMKSSPRTRTTYQRSRLSALITSVPLATTSFDRLSLAIATSPLNLELSAFPKFFVSTSEWLKSEEERVRTVRRSTTTFPCRRRSVRASFLSLHACCCPNPWFSRDTQPITSNRMCNPQWIRAVPKPLACALYRSSHLPHTAALRCSIRFA